MDLVDRLAKTYTGAVHDVMQGMGLRDFTLPPDIRPLAPDQVLAGVVATVSGKVDETADAHRPCSAGPASYPKPARARC